MDNPDVSYKKREDAREKYEPDDVRWLFIAEAPPRDLDRYFYFENVVAHDTLFLETMQALYRRRFPEISVEFDHEGDFVDIPENWKPDIQELGHRKEEFLKRFKEDEFHLIDALEYPLPEGVSVTSARTKLVRAGLKSLARRIGEVNGPETEIILVSASVCAQKEALEKEDKNFRIINTTTISFPGSGRQKVYRREMTKIPFSFKKK